MNQKRAVLLLKVVLWLGALAPAGFLLLGMFVYPDWVGANPIERLTHVTGMTTLILLMLTLTVTPLRRVSGWNPVIRLRRPLGLFAFFYALCHFSIWFVFDMVFNVTWMLEDIAERPFITVGFAAFVILIPLALTSTKGWIRRLGRRWTTLHRGVYVAATLGVVHFYWFVKADTRLPLVFIAILAVLFGARLQAARQRRSGRRNKEPEAATAASGSR